MTAAIPYHTADRCGRRAVPCNHEAAKLINRISDAKAEKLLTEFEAAPPVS